MHELAGWKYTLNMELAGPKAFWEVRHWHPNYGTLLVDSWGGLRNGGAVTASYVASELWIGATEHLERTTGA